VEFIRVHAERCERVVDAAAPAGGFLWLDALHEEVTQDPEGFRAALERAGGTRIHDLHLQDAVNLQHPSFFDSTSDYDMLIFRKLAPGEGPPLAEAIVGTGRRRRIRLQEIVTRPITFFMFERLLVTVRNAQSKTIETTRARLLDARPRVSETNGATVEKQRLPARPEELALRLLNGMVDRYLELRQPLTDRLDQWQRDLLDPRLPFSRWTALLDARIELRNLENLCEEQYDALQELRDSYLEGSSATPQIDAFLVRVNDVMEHVQRVLSHARRLEATAESAVQLHFSAMAHRTNQVVRTLTVITAIFAPLTLVTGIFGMNFEHMPLLKDHQGFWVTLGSMAALALLLLVFFALKRYISDAPRRHGWPFRAGRR
jgi:Mg2+ and Co2+ transporter CorA